jgi:hypothetical protein
MSPKKQGKCIVDQLKLKFFEISLEKRMDYKIFESLFFLIFYAIILLIIAVMK